LKGNYMYRPNVRRHDDELKQVMATDIGGKDTMYVQKKNPLKRAKEVAREKGGQRKRGGAEGLRYLAE